MSILSDYSNHRSLISKIDFLTRYYGIDFEYIYRHMSSSQIESLFKEAWERGYSGDFATKTFEFGSVKGDTVHPNCRCEYFYIDEAKEKKKDKVVINYWRCEEQINLSLQKLEVI